MRKLLLICLFLTSCCFAQSNDYDFIWDPNIEPDIKSYKIWIWEGKDTTQAVIENFQYHGEFPHDSLVVAWGLDSLVLVDTYSSLENGEYLKWAIKAIDFDLNQSVNYAYSKAYKKDDKVCPADVGGSRTSK